MTGWHYGSTEDGFMVMIVTLIPPIAETMGDWVVL